MLIYSVLTLFVAAVFSSVNGECNVCQTNGASCVNSTSFYLCYGNRIPNYDNLYHCKEGFDCTDLTAICAQSTASRPASCGDTSLCGLCRAHQNYLFACTSRTTFRMCYGSAHPKSEIGYCPDRYLCDASSNNVCVPPAQVKSITCDIINPNDGNPGVTTETPNKNTTTDKPITPGTPLTAQEVCDVEQMIGVYQIPGDISCLQYIRCYMQRGVIYGSLQPCPANTYFNGEILQCVLTKPSYCL